jgi:hypothetical protein
LPTAPGDRSGRCFEIEDLGPQPLAGFAEPQPAWRVVGESGVVSRFEALRLGTTPLVGRNEELDLLLRRWQQARSGEGRVALVSGEPGIGKSRLTVALSQHIESQPHTRLRYFCSPHHQDSALYPFIGQLERAAGFARDDTTATRLDKLEALLGDGAEPGDLSLIAETLRRMVTKSSAYGPGCSVLCWHHMLSEIAKCLLVPKIPKWEYLPCLKSFHWAVIFEMLASDGACLYQKLPSRSASAPRAFISGRPPTVARAT